MLNAEDIKPGWYEARMRTWPLEEQHAFVKVTGQDLCVWQCGDARPYDISDWQFFRRVDPGRGPVDLLFAAELTYGIVSRRGLAGGDQNPKGFLDMLGMAILRAGGFPRERDGKVMTVASDQTLSDLLKPDTRPILERLRHAATTACNDDLSEPMTVKRARHTRRVQAIQDGADELERLIKTLVEAEWWISTQPKHDAMCKRIRDVLDHTNQGKIT